LGRTAVRPYNIISIIGITGAHDPAP